jgi:hypothetical protein
MIRLLPLDRRHTGRLRKRDNLLAGGVGEEPDHTTARKTGSKSFNTLLFISTDIPFVKGGSICCGTV